MIVLVFFKYYKVSPFICAAMSSRWTKLRREKRKYEEYIHGDVRPTTSTASTSSTTISSSGIISTTSQEAENELDAIVDTAANSAGEGNCYEVLMILPNLKQNLILENKLQGMRVHLCKPKIKTGPSNTR